MIDSFYQMLAKMGYTHPLHPTLTHVVMGLVIGGFVFGLVAGFLKRPKLAQSARHCIGLALITLVPTVVLGYMDWQFRYAGAWLFPIKIKIALAAVLLVLLLIAIFIRRQADRWSKNVIVVYALCLVTVVVIGYFGGELVYGKRAQAGEAQKGLIEQGAVVFNQSCAVCHYPDKAESKIGPGLKALYKREKFPVSGLPVTDANVRNQLKTPFKNMPPFPQLSGEKVKALIAYLKSL